MEISVKGDNAEEKKEQVVGNNSAGKAMTKEINNIMLGNKLVLSLEAIEGETSISGLELTDSKLSSFANNR